MPILILDSDAAERQAPGGPAVPGLRVILDILTRDHHRRITIQLDGNAEYPGFEECLKEMVAGGFQVKAHVSNPNAVLLRLLRRHGMPVVIILAAPRPCDDSPTLCSLSEAEIAAICDAADTEVFLPLASPLDNLESMRDTVDVLSRARRVTLGVSWTDSQSGPASMSVPECSRWADGIISMCRRLTQDKVEVAFACGLPLCLFSRDQLGSLASLRVLWPVAHCTPPTYISMHGHVRCCPKIAGPRPINMVQIGSFEKARREIETWLAPFRSLCGSADVVSCRSLKTLACGGGCPAFSLDGWQRRKDVP